MKATNLQLFTAQLQLFEYTNATIWITFPSDVNKATSQKAKARELKAKD